MFSDLQRLRNPGLCALLLLLLPLSARGDDLEKARQAAEEGMEAYNRGLALLEKAETTSGAAERSELSRQARQRFAKAASRFRTALVHDSRDARLSLYLGRAEWRTGHAVEALLAWRQTIRIDGRGPWAEQADAEIAQHRREFFRWSLDEARTLQEQKAFEAALEKYLQARGFATTEEQQRTLYLRYWRCAGEWLATLCETRGPSGVVAIGPFTTSADETTASGRELTAHLLSALGDRGRPVVDFPLVRRTLQKAKLDPLRDADTPEAEKELEEAHEAAIYIRGHIGQTIRVRIRDLTRNVTLASPTLFAIRPRYDPGSALERLALSTYLHAESRVGRDVEVRDLGPGATLRSGDQLQIVFSTNRAAHTYVVWFDSGGTAHRLYPGTERLFPELREKGLPPENPIPPDTEIIIPHRDLYLRLDDQTGKETIVVIASLDPLQNLEGLLKEIEQTGEGTARLRQRIADYIESVQGVTVGGDVPRHLSTGREIERPTETTVGTGVVVRTLTLDHK